ncbi:MAG: hypothetical protein U0441_36480 [Polyangiaceae bacterium]
MRSLFCTVLLVLGTFAPPLSAQPTPTEIENAKKVAAEAANNAFEDFNAGKYDEAIAGFQKADKWFHAPKFGLYIGRAQAKQGKLLAAKATFEALIAEQLAAYAPKEFFSAQADAKKDLADLTKRIPTLTIQVKGVVTGVTLDGQPAKIGEAVQLDPGAHVIAGVGPDQGRMTTKLTLAEGDAKTETLEPIASAPPTGTPTATAFVVPTTTAAVPTAQPTAQLTPTATAQPTVTASHTSEPVLPSPPSSGSHVVSYVAFSAAGIALIAGGVLGGLTLAKQSDYLHGTRTTERMNEVNTFATAADTLLSLAAIGAIAGIVAWVQPPIEDAPNKKSARRILFVPTPGGALIYGNF